MVGPFRVLALDGGGIRGVLPALLLDELLGNNRQFRLQPSAARAFIAAQGAVFAEIAALVAPPA